GVVPTGADSLRLRVFTASINSEAVVLDGWVTAAGTFVAPYGGVLLRNGGATSWPTIHGLVHAKTVRMTNTAQILGAGATGTSCSASGYAELVGEPAESPLLYSPFFPEPASIRAAMLAGTGGASWGVAAQS